MTDTNTGYGNTHDDNTGHRNNGLKNSGDANCGDNNTGNCNFGDNNCNNDNNGCGNAGYGNTGDGNTGSRNDGCHNTGSWNKASGHVGYFNTIDAREAYFFNRICSVEEWRCASIPLWLHDIKATQWVVSSDMTDAEKEANPSYKETGGYLRVNNMQEQYRKAYAAASEEDRELTRKLPNFDPEVFLEITGVDMREVEQPREIKIDGKVYTLVKKQDCDDISFEHWSSNS